MNARIRKSPGVVSALCAAAALALGSMCVATALWAVAPWWDLRAPIWSGVMAGYALWALRFRESRAGRVSVLLVGAVALVGSFWSLWTISQLMLASAALLFLLRSALFHQRLVVIGIDAIVTCAALVVALHLAASGEGLGTVTWGFLLPQAIPFALPRWLRQAPVSEAPRERGTDFDLAHAAAERAFERILVARSA